MSHLTKSLMRYLTVMLYATGGLVHAQDAPKAKNVAVSGLETLYALDPVTQSFSFTENHAGGVTHNNRALANGGEISFGAYIRNGFSVGISTDAKGSIVDIGTAQTLREKYQYDETVGEGQGFASIHRKGQTILINNKRDANDGTSEWQELKEASGLFGRERTTASTPTFLGHIYLLHIVKDDRGNGPTNMFVKLLVVAFAADQYATIRWEILADE